MCAHTLDPPAQDRVLCVYIDLGVGLGTDECEMSTNLMILNIRT